MKEGKFRQEKVGFILHLHLFQYHQPSILAKKDCLLLSTRSLLSVFLELIGFCGNSGDLETILGSRKKGSDVGIPDVLFAPKEDAM